MVIDALASPRQGERLLADRSARSRHSPIAGSSSPTTIPTITSAPIVFRQAGAKVIAHPGPRVLASEGGEDALMADWVRVVGLDAMRGFEFADMPDRPVTRADTLRLGGRTHRDLASRGRALAGRSDGLAAAGAGAVRGRCPGRGRGDDGGGRELAPSCFGPSATIDSLDAAGGGAGARCDPERARADLVAPHPRVHHRICRPTCERRWRRACRCSGRWPRCRRPTRPGRSRSIPGGAGTRCGSTGGGAGLHGTGLDP